MEKVAIDLANPYLIHLHSICRQLPAWMGMAAEFEADQ